MHVVQKTKLIQTRTNKIMGLSPSISKKNLQKTKLAEKIERGRKRALINMDAKREYV